MTARLGLVHALTYIHLNHVKCIKGVIKFIAVLYDLTTLNLQVIP